MNVYEIGDRVRVQTDTPFQNVAGTALDPDTVTFEIKAPAVATSQYVYDQDGSQDAAITRLATGDYAIDVDAATAGRWYYYVVGEDDDGTFRGAHQGVFGVRHKAT